MTTPCSAPASSLLLRWLSTAILAALVGGTTSHAIWEVAEGELFITTDAGISHDSNITGRGVLPQSDTVFSLTPGLSFVRDRGRASLSMAASSTISRYQEFDEQDSEDYQATLGLDVPATASGRLQGSFNAGYFDGSRIDQFLGDRVATQSYNLALRGSYQATNKISTRFGTTYRYSDPDGGIRNTNRTYSIGAGYNLRPALSTFADLRFSKSSTGGGTGLARNSGNSGTGLVVGLDGQITRRISGRAGVGVERSEIRTTAGTRSETNPSYDVGLTWQPRQQTSVSLDASSDFGTTSIGGTTENVSLALSVSQEIGQRINARASLTHRSSDFSSVNNRNDDVLGFTVNASYAIGNRATVSAGYAYTNSDSTGVITNYTRSVWSLSAGARF